MRTRIVPSLVAVLAMVAVSCEFSSDSESRSQTGSVAAVTGASAADTTVQSSDASTLTTDRPAADPTVQSSDASTLTTDRPAADPTVQSSDDPTPPATDLPAPGPLALTPAQLADLSLSDELMGEQMAAKIVEVDNDSFWMGLIGDALPPGTEVEAHDYWSLDSGRRTIGEGPVDVASVIMLLLAQEPEVVPLFDAIANAEPEYTRWVPITIRGATVAEQSEAIHYEGEPDDEPDFDGILARTDKLIVMVTVSGSDADARVETAIALVELVFERAGELSGDGSA